MSTIRKKHIKSMTPCCESFSLKDSDDILACGLGHRNTVPMFKIVD